MMSPSSKSNKCSFDLKEASRDTSESPQTIPFYNSKCQRKDESGSGSFNPEYVSSLPYIAGRCCCCLEASSAQRSSQR